MNFDEFFDVYEVTPDDKGGHIINVQSVKANYDSEHLCELLEGMGDKNVVFHLPLNKVACGLSMLEDDKFLAPSSGYVRQLTVDTDQMVDFHYMDYLSRATKLCFAMRRPDDGVTLSYTDDFIDGLLSYLPPDIEFSFVLFKHSNKGPMTKLKKVPPKIKQDLERVDGLFRGFKAYKGCTYQKRISKLIERY